MQQFELQNKRNFDKFAEMQDIVKPTQVTQNIHSLVQAYIGQFKVDRLKVQYNGANKKWTQYIFNSAISHNQSAKFKFKIIKSKDNSIMIGVTDYAKQKDQRTSCTSKNAMCYYGADG